MITERFLLGRGRHFLSGNDLAVLDAAVGRVTEVEANKFLIRRGEPVRAATMLLDGFACRYMDDRDGRRQNVAIHVPGDFIDLHGFPMGALDHDIVTMSPVRIATVDHEQLQAIMAERPFLTRMLWFSTLLDAALHREWIFRLGRLSADGRVAHLFAEIETRLSLVGLSDGTRFRLPMTQAELGETCGITGVHVNRVLRRLREENVLAFASGQATILDRRGLHRMGEFVPDYLYLGGTWGAHDDRA